MTVNSVTVDACYLLTGALLVSDACCLLSVCCLGVLFFSASEVGRLQRRDGEGAGGCPYFSLWISLRISGCLCVCVPCYNAPRIASTDRQHS